MKTKLLASAALVCGFIASSPAAPLALNTAVHTRPDNASPTISILKAGTEPSPAVTMTGTTPAGWMAVELAGPFEGYVENKDLSKSLDVKPGVSIRLAPKADAGVLAVAEKDDKATITGLRGKWTQISLEKKLVGYVNVGGSPSAVPRVATSPATAGLPPSSSSSPMSPAPVSPAAYGAAAPGQTAVAVNVGDPSSALPRQFAGRFVSTRRVFTPRRPYDYALNDDAGKRYAYVDTSKLLLTEQLENYIDHAVVVFGAAMPIPGTKDIVIRVETLQLK